MLADFYIPRLSNDMKIAVQKKHFWGQILYRSSDPSKKRRLRNHVSGSKKEKYLFLRISPIWKRFVKLTTLEF